MRYAIFAWHNDKSDGLVLPGEEVRVGRGGDGLRLYVEVEGATVWVL